MANPVITNNDSSPLVVFGPEYQQEQIVFTDAQTYAEGAPLARKHISDTVAQAPDAGNTGDGTVTNQALGSGGPAKVGAYNLECVTAVADGGVFKLEDPSGKLLVSDITIPAGAGNSIDFEGFGLKFTITDGATDFIVGDKFAITTTADGKLYAYDISKLDGRDQFVALMPEARTEASAGTYNDRVLIGGEVRQTIVESAYGSTLTAAQKDELKAIGFILRPRTNVDEYDNQ